MPMTVEEGTPVPVRIVQDDVRNIPPKEVPRERAGTVNSYVLAVGALPVQILAHTPKRCRATIIVNGSTVSVVAFGGSQSDCQAAASAAAGEFVGEVAYVIGAYASPIEVQNTDELWAVLVVAGSGPTVVSAFKEIYT
jgi:hypothetical protein